MTAHKPRGLGKSGTDLWRSVMDHEANYRLRPDELRILADACHEADLIAQLEEAQRDEPLTTKGSMGQKVISPYISEMRQHRTVLANLLKSLKLPDTPAATAAKTKVTSDQARAAARARWGTRQTG